MKTDAPIKGSTPTQEPPAPAPVVHEAVHEYLTFILAGEVYGLPLNSVREILKPSPITRVPRAASHVLGIISVRGSVTTVVDLRKRLRLPAAVTDRNARILLVSRGEEVIGLWVDRVEQVRRLSDGQIELASSLNGDTADHIHGIGRPMATVRGRRGRTVDSGTERSENDILILLDPAALLRL